ncbi:Uncharacterized protein PECH_002576 [Penicillium ucsense]|uniref:Uncharacterized protein n=1 Tax=Penicillium ucsense TaxID=2839758 RepID=A0A8J8VWS2_9EURO|nr:Uncharacterized protein PECM_002029 [Penicillium ucsense]KAF7730734.1 Uncharacterized protein PECH_002576 [Penicillium ucsense]
MSVSDETIQNIQKFIKNRQTAETESSAEPLGPTALHAYARRLDGTLQQLQAQVQHQEEELNRLRETRGSFILTDKDEDPWTRVAQARRAKKAYNSLILGEDDLPRTESVLPALIAVEETSYLIREGKASLHVIADNVSADRERFRIEEANLRDSREIANGLRERIQRIRNTESQKQERTPSQVAREVVREQKAKNQRLEKATEDLKKSIDNFIDISLAPMLAAEDMGGPNVGDDLEVSDATLRAGYTASGKPKKPKEAVEQTDSNQQRIDQFLQQSTTASAPATRRETVAQEAHELLAGLLEAGSSYIDLKRDSAASRFLVRAKVAQFHPRDARRLRLIDFGRSLDDRD